MTKRKEKHLMLFVVFSLLIHWLALWILSHPLPEKRAELDPLDLIIIKPYRIADIEPPEDSQRPDEADFLGAL